MAVDPQRLGDFADRLDTEEMAAVDDALKLVLALRSALPGLLPAPGPSPHRPEPGSAGLSHAPRLTLPTKRNTIQRTRRTASQQTITSRLGPLAYLLGLEPGSSGRPGR
jgi:hypothetical protein